MNTRRCNIQLFALAVITIPLNLGDRWRVVSYPNIPVTEAAFSDAGATLKVRASSSPLVYRLEAPVHVTRLIAAGKVSALPRLPTETKEGDDGADDFALRVGLIVEGDGGPSWVERIFAPRWIKDLIHDAPGMRFSRVQLLSLSQQLPIAFRRRHPKSGYVDEEVVGKLTGPGAFAFDHELREKLPVFAVWLHADGDDTKSEFDVTLTRLALTTDQQTPDRTPGGKR